MTKGECESCGQDTYARVPEVNGTLIYLCIDCRDKFERCDICEEYHYKDYIHNKICDTCRENIESQESEKSY